MSDEELLYCVALTMLQDVGSITAKKLIAYTGSCRAVFRESSSTLMKIPGIGSFLTRRIRSSDILRSAEKEMEYIRKYGIVPLYFLNEDYPERLRNCIDGPVILYLQGDNCLSAGKILSVVGTRKATEYGRNSCKTLIEKLSDKYNELIIVSGLAYGIDITAHRTALQQGLKTVAVLGHGFKTVYPSDHRATAINIRSQGCLVTDFNSSMGPERNNFIRRNRIIAGLSDATLVVESDTKGGALITADIASSYDREVLAVPGRSVDQYSRGCNKLIKKNIAALVEEADDIEFALRWEADQKGKENETAQVITFTEEERKVLTSIHEEPDLIPEIISKKTNIPIHRILSLLIEMELRGWLLSMPGNRYSLKVRL
jgi:DNA processing protein